MIVILIIAIIALLRESYRYFRISQEVKNLEEKIKKLKKDNEEMAKLERYFQSDDFLEKEARLKLNLTKPGEKLIIIKTPEGFKQEQKEQNIAKQISNIQKWWEYLFGRR